MDPNAPAANADALTPAEEPLRPWLRQNASNLVIGAILAGVVFYFLHPVDVIMAVAGLSLIIFIHELGHFAAAKLCKVRVKTFSFFGLGPAIPGLAYKYGETTYQISIIPLGGYVSMIGEGDNAEGEEAENDPRSFKNQSVPERMLIISAGVIMNLILAFMLFVVVYMHGLEEQPAVIATVEPGGALWRHGVHTGTVIESIDGRSGLFFEDVRPIVWNTVAGEKLNLQLDDVSDKGRKYNLAVEPRQEEGAPFPLLGFAPPASLKLFTHPRDPSPPYRAGSAASQARTASGDPGFLPGDEIVAMTNPDRSGEVTPITAPAGSFNAFEYERRMAQLAGQTVTVQVRRKGAPADAALVKVVVPPERRYETGLRMRMGSIIAIRQGSPGAAAGLLAKDGPTDGDRIIEVEVTNPDNHVVVFAADPSEVKSTRKNSANLTVHALDPLRLPWQLLPWSQTATAKKVKLTLLRNVDHAEKRIVLDLDWDPIGAADLGENGASPTTPVAINGLGLAYQVQAAVDGVQPGSAAATAGLQAGDTIESIKFHSTDAEGKVQVSGWEKVQSGQWAFVDRVLQWNSPHSLDVRVIRGGQTIEATLSAVADDTCPVVDRGLSFLPEYRIQKASDVGEALNMGVRRTVRMIKNMYINLYAMAFGRVSAIQTMSGPITLARLSYKIAGESSYKLILLLALISINLAVVNFLPIPMLDGGHMMFLIYELFVGRPPPERIHAALMWVGVIMVISLMVFVIGLDIWRLLKMWFGW